MEFKIFQIADLENCEYLFMSYSFAKKHDFNRNDYKQVYCAIYPELDDKDDMDALEDIFRLCNRITDEDCARLEIMGYNARSLSVSDIVQLEDKFYYCDPAGWVLLE